jgi:hypothetical protein
VRPVVVSSPNVASVEIGRDIRIIIKIWKEKVLKLYGDDCIKNTRKSKNNYENKSHNKNSIAGVF